MAAREEQARRVRGKGGKKNKKPAGSGSTSPVGLRVAGGLLVLVGVIIGSWLLFSGGKKQPLGQEDDPEGALDITREPASVRAQRSVVGLDISLPVAAAPDPWTVTPDAVKPAEGMRSLLAWPVADELVRPHALLFARADVAQAAVLSPTPKPKTWIRYDLKAIDPIGQVDLGDYAEAPDMSGRVREIQFLADLSPTGERLAMQPVDNPPRLIVWSSDGKRVASLKPPDVAVPPTWFGFVDDERLLVLMNGKLQLRDINTGKVAYTVEGKFRGSPVLSAGRTWVAAFDGTAFVWVRTADGKVCGRTPTPELKAKAGQFHGEATCAFSPDGTLFLASRTTSGAMGFFRCLSVWDVATGKPIDSSDHSVGGGLPESLQWCGPRQILLGGARLIDLDLGLATGAGGYRTRDAGVVARTTPDGRFWYMPSCKRPYVPNDIDSVLLLLKDSKHRDAVAKSGFVLAAFSLPETAKARIDAHKHAATLGKMSVRVHVQNDDRGYRRQAGEALADALAAVGCRVSPQAEGAARLTISPVKSDLVRKLAAGIPGFRAEEFVPGKIVAAKLEVLDGSGAVRLSLAFDESEPDTTADMESVVRKKVLDRLGRLLGGQRDAGAGTLPPLDVAEDLGIDGVPNLPQKK